MELINFNHIFMNIILLKMYNKCMNLYIVLDILFLNLYYSI